MTLGYKSLNNLCGGTKYSPNTLRKDAIHSVKILRDIHRLNIVHSDLLLANFVVTNPKGKDREVDLLLIDFESAQTEERGTCASKPNSDEDYTEYAFSTVDTMIRRLPRKSDDVCQLGYMLLVLFGYDMNGFYKPQEKKPVFKQKLSDHPEKYLVGDFQLFR